jgi:hypothetical protein
VSIEISGVPSPGYLLLEAGTKEKGIIITVQDMDLQHNLFNPVNEEEL